jgi:uncharacterized protein (TIGR03437 family)
MRRNAILISMASAVALLAAATPAAAVSFGSVVPIGGHAADIALDESRGVLYVANYTANRIDVMSTADNTIHSSINVAPGPGSLALSPDAQFLVVTHYANTTTADPTNNLITVINLNGNTRQTFYTGDAPLGVAFLNAMPPATSGIALIVTTTSFVTFDPLSGTMTVLATIAELSQTLPVPTATFPGQILEAALGSSANGQVIWGVAGAGTATQLVFRYTVGQGLQPWGFVTSPALLPRVSVSSDGSFALVGYLMVAAMGPNGVAIAGRYPNVIASPNITGHAIDSVHGIVYGQFPDTTQPAGPPLASGAALQPSLIVMDSDNLTVRDRITLPENLVGRGVINSAGSVLYAISDSGVTMLPVGSLNQYNRVAPSQEDVFVQTNFCNSSTVVQTLAITDPGGGNTDFTITPSQAGVTVSPSSGFTPATVQIRVDPTAFKGTTGTTAVTLKIASNSAVNQPRSVRLLMNNPDSDQRGTIVDVPGTLTDILPDPSRNRFYIVRQDKNQVQVFDGGTNQLIQTLRTATTPTTMSLTIDGKYLLVGHNDSQLVMVYDLDALQAQTPVVLPPGHYGRSIAQSNAALLVLSRDEGTGTGAIDRINNALTGSYELPTLGVWQNVVSTEGVLSPSPNGASILMAGADGNLMLYSAAADTFTVSRKDFTSLTGAYAASSYNTYVVGNTAFNSSLVPEANFSTSNGGSSGFAFVNQGGYMATTPAAAGAGVMQNIGNVTATQAGSVMPVRMVEAPLLPVTGAATTTTGTGTGSTGSGSGSSTSTGTGSGSGTGTGTTTGTGSVSVYTYTAFTRTVAPMPSAGTVVVLTTSGFSVLAANYGASVAPPTISSVVNAADGTQPVAPGGLISAYGQQMSPVNMATSQIPLPTALGDSCLSVNGTPVPLLYVSSQQINAQLPFNVTGNATVNIHSPGGISNNYYFTVSPAAPSVFRSGSAGPTTGLATIVRNDDGQLVTPTNPLHTGDSMTIYLTGMGATTPQVDAGLPAPTSPLAQASIQPTVTLGGAGLNVGYAGLAPGEVGVYQINASVPSNAPQGLTVPLVISQGGGMTEIDVRVVK